MRTLEIPSTWEGLNKPYASIFPQCTFSIPLKGVLFSGVHSLEIEDELLPVVVTIEQLFMDYGSKDVLAFIDPAIVQRLEDELARN